MTRTTMGPVASGCMNANGHKGRSAANGRGAVRNFAQYRRERMAKSVARLTVTMIAAVALIVGALFGLGRIAHWGPFAPGIPEAKYSAQSWNMIVVNRWHRIPDDYPAPELTQLANGQQVDSRIYPDLQRMFDAMRADGLDPEVTAGYRTHAQQQQIMSDKVFLYENQGMSAKDATREAEQLVAIPGTSEHEIGLAVDLNAVGAANADANQRVYNWLAANAWAYGFILRYPDGKTDVTGNQYEPWHYRFVGADVAKAIHDRGITLEEYTR
ncbi:MULTISPECIES: M15 family metallopeptidase [Bifidobacterium]|uniref:M15 family metallopeptidase n=1 Tax=Bifidobacterium TaxID=1678 RepID=UPI001F0A4AB8|nr:MULTISPECIES: M15 family metallopeptidase [Bifidobacterium]